MIGNPPPSGEGDREAVEGANLKHRSPVLPPPPRVAWFSSPMGKE